MAAKSVTAATVAEAERPERLLTHAPRPRKKKRR
jgi:hypothetical protein